MIGLFRLVLIDLLNEADLTVLEPAASADATAIIAFRMRSARKFAARSGTMPLLAQLPPIVPGRPRFAKLAYCREIGIQLGSISLYDAGDASFIPLSPGQPVTPLKVIFLADTRPGHYHLAEGVIAAVARLRPVEVTRIDVKRKWIVPTRWLRRRINAESFFPPRMLRMAYRIDADDAAEGRSRGLRRRRDADAEYLRHALSRRAQRLLRLAVARAGP